jgi:hypothetical protein
LITKNDKLKKTIDKLKEKNIELLDLHELPKKKVRGMQITSPRNEMNLSQNKIKILGE